MRDDGYQTEKKQSMWREDADGLEVDVRESRNFRVLV